MRRPPGDPFVRAVTPDETLRLASAVFLRHFPGQSTEFISVVFQQVQNAFAGTYPGYQRCDTAFHDLAHTCQATAATVRILDGHLKSGQPPALAPRDFELALVGILLHDIGFLKADGDDDGTGAKYTPVHVDRSVKFAEEFLPRFGVTPDEVCLVRSAIQCTATNGDMGDVRFRDDRERFIGCALGTGDILGTMAAPDYPERLPALYQEFAEAASAYSRVDAVGHYANVEDLLRRTRGFYQDYVRRMLDREWGRVYRVLEYHFPDGTNHYLQAIESNLDRIDRILAGAPRTR